MNQLLIFLFSKLPILNWVDGYKTKIGDTLAKLSVILLALQQGLLEWGIQIPLLDKSYAWVTLLIGFLAKWIGEAHAAAKEANK